MVTAFMWYYASYHQGNSTAKPYVDSLAAGSKLSPIQIHYAKLKAKQYIISPVVAERTPEGKS